MNVADAVLQKHFEYLTEHMDPDNGLLSELLSMKLVNFREMESIRARRTYCDRNECLLKTFKKKSISIDNLRIFIQSLRCVRQPHLADKLSSALEELSC